MLVTPAVSWFLVLVNYLENFHYCVSYWYCRSKINAFLSLHTDSGVLLKTRGRPYGLAHPPCMCPHFCHLLISPFKSVSLEPQTGSGSTSEAAVPIFARFFHFFIPLQNPTGSSTHRRITLFFHPKSFNLLRHYERVKTMNTDATRRADQMWS